MQIQQQFFARFLVALFSLVLFCAGTLKADESLDLKVEFPAGRQFRIVAQFEHSGNVIVDSPDTTESGKQKVAFLPLNVDARLTFTQRTTGPQQSIRFYEQAVANITLDKGKTRPALVDSNRMIIARLKSESGKNVEMASISDTLGQDELELIRHAGDPLTLSRLINKSNLKTGQQWSPKHDDLAKFLGVQDIDRSDVKLKLKTFDANSARIYIVGTVVANADDVSTELEISGVITVDRKNNIVSALKMGVRETRPHGQVAPGFEGTSKIELAIQPTAGTPKLSSQSLTKLTKNRKIRQRVRWTSNANQFVLKYEPQWRMIAEEHDAAILRYLKKGEVLAQCNVVLLPPRPANAPLKLDDYKKEVAKMVADNTSAHLTAATESRTESGHRIVRVVVAATQEGLPIKWVYYHVAANDGRQITFVFTMAESVFNQINPVAKQLVGEFVFNAASKQVASQKGAAVKTANPAAQSSKKR